MVKSEKIVEREEYIIFEENTCGSITIQGGPGGAPPLGL